MDSSVTPNKSTAKRNLPRIREVIKRAEDSRNYRLRANQYHSELESSQRMNTLNGEQAYAVSRWKQETLDLKMELLQRINEEKEILRRDVEQMDELEMKIAKQKRKHYFELVDLDRRQRKRDRFKPGSTNLASHYDEEEAKKLNFWYQPSGLIPRSPIIKVDYQLIYPNAQKPDLYRSMFQKLYEREISRINEKSLDQLRRKTETMRGIDYEDGLSSTRDEQMSQMGIFVTDLHSFHREKPDFTVEPAQRSQERILSQIQVTQEFVEDLEHQRLLANSHSRETEQVLENCFTRKKIVKKSMKKLKKKRNKKKDSQAPPLTSDATNLSEIGNYDDSDDAIDVVSEFMRPMEVNVFSETGSTVTRNYSAEPPESFQGSETEVSIPASRKNSTAGGKKSKYPRRKSQSISSKSSLPGSSRRGSGQAFNQSSLTESSPSENSTAVSDGKSPSNPLNMRKLSVILSREPTLTSLDNKPPIQDDNALRGESDKINSNGRRRSSVMAAGSLSDRRRSSLLPDIGSRRTSLNNYASPEGRGEVDSSAQEWQDVQHCRYLRGYEPPEMRMDPNFDPATFFQEIHKQSDSATTPEELFSTSQ